MTLKPSCLLFIICHQQIYAFFEQPIPRYSVVMVDISAALEAETFHLRHRSRTKTSATGTVGPIIASFDSGVPK